MNPKSFSREKTLLFLVAATIFLTIFLRIPFDWLPFQLTKSMLLIIGTSVAGITLLLESINRFRLPVVPWSLAYVGISLVGVTAAATYASPVQRLSLAGQYFEADTLISMIALVLLLLVTAHLFASRRGLPIAFAALMAAYLGVAGIFILQLIGGVIGKSLLPLSAGFDPRVNVIGDWHNLAVYIGGFVLLALGVMTRFELPRLWKTITMVSLGFGIFFLTFFNFPFLLLFLGVLVVLIVATQSPVLSGVQEGVSEEEQGRQRQRLTFAALTIILFAGYMAFAGGSIRSFLVGTFNTDYTEVRPTLSGTIDLARESYKDGHWLLGVGPARFSDAWQRYHSADINTTDFWNISFETGYGVIPSKAVTLGIVGFLVWAGAALFFIWMALLSIFGKGRNPLSMPLGVGVLYYWVMAFLFPLNLVNLVIAFFLTGLMFALRERDRKVIELPKGATRDVFSVVGYVGIVGLIVVLGFSAKRVIAESVFQLAAARYDAPEKYEQTRARIISALRLSQEERYLQGLTAMSLGQIQLTASQTTEENQEEMVAQISEYAKSAIQSAEAAYVLNKERVTNAFNLAEVYALLAGLGDENAAQQAVLWYQVGRQLSPNNPSIPLRQGEIMMAANALEQAEASFKEALSMKPNYTAAAFDLAEAQLRGGDEEAALASALEGVRNDANNPVAFFQLGVLNYGLNKNDVAIDALRNALLLSPDYANARYFLALALDRDGQTEQALSQLKKIQESNPENELIQKNIETLEAGGSISENTTSGLPLEEDTKNAPSVDAEPQSTEVAPVTAPAVDENAPENVTGTTGSGETVDSTADSGQNQ